MKKISFPSANGNIFIHTDDVSHIASEGERYSWIIFISGKRKLIHVALCDVIQLVPSPPFYQVNDSHIVHINQIKRVIGEYPPKIELTSGLSISISKQLIDQLLQ